MILGRRGTGRLVPVLFLLASGALPGQVAEFRVRETAGLRRFGYPVRARFQTATPAEGLRLLEEGKPIPVQFTRLDGGLTEADFSVSLSPFEARGYRVERGAGAAVSGGLTVEETTAAFAVHYLAELEFQIPKNLRGLLNAVSTPRASYLRGQSPGLVLRDADGHEARAGSRGPAGVATRARVIKAGPLAALLRFESAEAIGGGRNVKSIVEMEFPRSKSWVEVRWVVEDPGQRVAGMMADLNLLLDERPMLVDFGAGTMVYAALRPGQGASMLGDVSPSGRQSWRVDVGDAPYAAGSGRAEGWAHVMDPRRATAIAIADFARSGPVLRDSISVSQDGRLRIRRDFSRGLEKRLTFWLHFVDTPVQVGAATSPQSMLQPPKIEWK